MKIKIFKKFFIKTVNVKVFINMKKTLKIILIISIFIPLLIYFTGFGKTALSILKYYAPLNLGIILKKNYILKIFLNLNLKR